MEKENKAVAIYEIKSVTKNHIIEYEKITKCYNKSNIYEELQVIIPDDDNFLDWNSKMIMQNIDNHRYGIYANTINGFDGPTFYAYETEEGDSKHFYFGISHIEDYGDTIDYGKLIILYATNTSLKNSDLLKRLERNDPYDSDSNIYHIRSYNGNMKELFNLHFDTRLDMLDDAAKEIFNMIQNKQNTKFLEDIYNLLYYTKDPNEDLPTGLKKFIGFEKSKV